MSPEAWGLATLIVTALIAGAGWVVKEMWAWLKPRLAAPTAAPAAVPESGQLNLSQATEMINGVSSSWATRLVKLEAEMQEVRADRDQMRARVDRIGGVLVRFVNPLVEWLDNGAKHPPPVVAEELRSVLAELAGTSEPKERA